MPGAASGGMASQDTGAVMGAAEMALSDQLAAGPAANIEGLMQVGELGLGLLLSAVIGLEREVRQKSAGLRTHSLVGVGVALFMLVSKYGFNDVLRTGQVIVDPSRVAAQIVTGIGFIGSGLIFVRRDSVHGLNTAALAWVTAAVGAACGAGLPLLAVAATVAYLVIAVAFQYLSRRLVSANRGWRAPRHRRRRDGPGRTAGPRAG
jgi:putative Mg2+ transporter-C (MgtC) family protein